MTAVLHRSREEVGTHRPPVPPSRRLLSRRPSLPLLLVAVCGVLWLLSLRSLGSVAQSQFGLLVSGSPLLVTSIALNTIAFGYAVRKADLTAAWAAVFVSVGALRLSMTLATSVPFYSWTYKHLAVVDYIKQTGEVARGVDIYQHWPGLFAATAWLSDISGLSATTIAHWYTPVAYLLEIALVYAMARAWDAPKLTAVVVVFLVESLDWIGQGYFSPQFTAFCLAVAILTLLGLSRKSATCAWLLVLLFTAVTITHQLTPYWLLLIITGLVITKRVKPFWIAPVCIAIAIGFLIVNYGAAGHYGLFSGGNPIANAQSNVKTVGVLGQRVTSLAVRAMSGIFWVAAIAVAAVRLKRRQPMVAASIVGFSSFPILLGQGYGGEAIFRVFLFALPGCAMLIAPSLQRFLQSRISLVAPLALGLAALTVVSAQGLFGPWSAWKMTKEEVKLANVMASTNPIPSYITPAGPVWPERNDARYVDFMRFSPQYDQTMVFEAKLTGTHFATDADYAALDNTVAGRTKGPTYLIITKQMQFYDWYFGILPYDALPNLQKRLVADPNWSVYYQSDDVMVFKSHFATQVTPAK